MKSILVVLLFTFSLFLGKEGYGQNAQSSGKDFWFGYMENLSTGVNNTPEFIVQLFAIDADASVEIEIPGRNYKRNVFLMAEEVLDIQLPSFDLEPRGSGVTSSLAVHLTSTSNIDVVAIHSRAFFSATTRLLPTASLGTDHMILAAKDYRNQSPSSMLVVATENDTEVKVCQSPCGAKGEFRFRLNQGETYQFQSPEDLTGTEIIGNKPIAVFSGAKQAALGEGDDSHIYNAMPPLNYADTVFAAVPHPRVKESSYLSILSLSDDTRVTIGGNTVFVNRGEKRDVKFNVPLIIKGSKPFFVSQYNSGSSAFLMGGTFGPSVRLLVPLNSRVKKMSFNTKKDIEWYGFKLIHGLCIIAEDTTNLRLNTNPISNFIKIPNSVYFYSTQVIDSGTYNLESPVGFIGNVYGSSPAEYYTFSLGYNDSLLVNSRIQSASDDCSNWRIASNLNNGEFQILENGSAIDGSDFEIYDSRANLVYKNTYIKINKQVFKPNLAIGMYYLRFDSCNTTKKFVVKN